jgi:hypothetical protein
VPPVAAKVIQGGLPETAHVGFGRVVVAERATGDPSTTLAAGSEAVATAGTTVSANGDAVVAVAARFGFPPPLSETRYPRDREQAPAGMPETVPVPSANASPGQRADRVWDTSVAPCSNA